MKTCLPDAPKSFESGFSYHDSSSFKKALSNSADQLYPVLPILAVRTIRKGFPNTALISSSVAQLLCQVPNTRTQITHKTAATLIGLLTNKVVMLYPRGLRQAPMLLRVSHNSSTIWTPYFSNSSICRKCSPAHQTASYHGWESLISRPWIPHWIIVLSLGSWQRPAWFWCLLPFVAACC